MIAVTVCKVDIILRSFSQAGTLTTDFDCIAN